MYLFLKTFRNLLLYTIFVFLIKLIASVWFCRARIINTNLFYKNFKVNNSNHALWKYINAYKPFGKKYTMQIVENLSDKNVVTFCLLFFR